MNRKAPEWSRTQTKQTAVLLALYGSLLAALAVFLFCGRQADVESYGSLEGRFASAITVTWQGKTYGYREMEVTNYLLIGVDQEAADGAESLRSVQADFLVLLCVDRRNRTITPLMVDRDTMAEVPTYGVFGQASGARRMQMCLAQAFHARGATGSENTVDALSGLLGGVIIDRYLAVDIGGIAILNDALGGVQVTLTEDLTAMDPAMVQGATLVLNGKQAEAFVRGRMTVGDGTNASRMNRQRVYLESLLMQLFAQEAPADAQLKQVLDALEGHIETNMRETEIFSDIQKYADYAWLPFATAAGVHTTGPDGFAEFWPDEDAWMQMMIRLWFR